MELLSLVLYGSINIAMVLRYFLGRDRFYEFPFWAGVIALGWFYPQAIGGYSKLRLYPEGAFASGMFFASLCTVALWFGFERAMRKTNKQNHLLSIQFNTHRLFIAGAFFIVTGFYFNWVLLSLPEEMLAQRQWTGAPVRYLFLSNIFKIGFLVLLVRYLKLRRWWNPQFLVFLIPCLLMLLSTAFLYGRRAGMMDLFSYLAVSIWFVRRFSIPKGGLVALVVIGVVLINGIGQYRSIMLDQEQTLSKRVLEVSNADWLASSGNLLEQSGREFSNYIMYRNFTADMNIYDFGLVHWNSFVFNYVPAQIVGKELKSSLMLPLPDVTRIADEIYGYAFYTGTVSTGYLDAFGSFWWFGFIKFLIIGWIMGVLYRYAIHQSFLSQILYVYVLTTAMHAISHGTNQILLSVWVYFFLLGFPMLYWARARRRQSARRIGHQVLSQGLGREAL
jgi:hypothetical protein